MYDENGNLSFEIKNGEGIVKELDQNKDFSLMYFEGEYVNGEKNGKGKIYQYQNKDYNYDNDDHEIFEGEFVKGEKKEKEKNFFILIRKVK